MTSKKVPTLYKWMGGMEAIERLVTTFYRLTLSDPLLKHFFEHMPPAHIHNVALWFGEVFDGPNMYSKKHEKDTVHPYMMSRHLDLQITEPQRKRWVEFMLQAADEVKLPTDPEFRSAFVAYLEWGTRIAMLVSRPGIKLPAHDPMPKWGWGEQKPQS